VNIEDDKNSSQNSLGESQLRFSKIIDSLDTPIILSDLHTHEIIYANQRMKEIFGDILEKECWRVLQSNQTEPCGFCTNHKLVGSDGKPSGELVWEAQNTKNKRWYENHAQAIYWTDGRLVRLEFATDIHDRKMAEKASLKLEAQIQQAQKYESLNVLAGNLSNQFNNILHALMGNLYLAMSNLPPGGPAETFIKEADEAANRAAKLSTLMLTYVGKQQAKMAPVHMGKLIKGMSGLVEVALSKRTELKISSSPDPPIIKGNKAQIEQVVMTLVTNAAEAIGNNPGKITITLGKVYCDSSSFEEPPFMDDYLPEGDYLFFAVSDTGCGMTKEVLRRIYDPFFTTKVTGRGLGMATVLGIIRSHKAAASITSDPGKGSTVRVMFPVIKEDVFQNTAFVENGQISMEVSDSLRNKGTVLIVDDEQLVLTVGRSMLKQLGIKVLTAPDGDKAVELFKEHAEDIEFVLLDFSMPKMDGIETFKKIKSIKENVSVILCSGRGKSEIAGKLQGVTPDGFIQKPYLLSSLLSLMRDLMKD